MAKKIRTGQRVERWEDLSRNESPHDGLDRLALSWWRLQAARESEHMFLCSGDLNVLH